MKIESIALIHSAPTSFASACKIVSDAMKDGQIEASRASANDKSAKTSTVHIADTSKMAPDALATLKRAVKLYNAGHAFQTAYGVKLAQVGDLCAYAKSTLADESKVVEMPAAPEAAAKPAKASKKEEKVA